MAEHDKSKVFAVELDEEKRISSVAVRELLEAVLERGRQFRFRAGGMSMFPFVRNGDVVTISPFQGDEPGVGDIVAFLQDRSRSLALHRVVSVHDRAYVVRGDSAVCADGRIPGKDILGKVVRIERDGRDVRFGLGSERRTIAMLSRLGLSGRLISCMITAWAAGRRLFVPRSEMPEDHNHKGA